MGCRELPLSGEGAMDDMKFKQAKSILDSKLLCKLFYRLFVFII
jgi:hypothetical protein